MSATNLLTGRDLPGLLKIGESCHALLTSLERPDAERFRAVLRLDTKHPYLPVFGWLHPITVSEVLRQMAVAAVRTSLLVPAVNDYALTRMRWRYVEPLALGPARESSLAAVELALGECHHREGMLSKLTMIATLLDAEEQTRCEVEMHGGFYPKAVLEALMREAVGDAVPPPPELPELATAEVIGIEEDQALITVPETIGEGRYRVQVHATTEHPFFHHNISPDQRWHVPAAMLIEAALQFGAALSRSGRWKPSMLRGMDVELRHYVALNRPDTELVTTVEAPRMTIELDQDGGARCRFSLDGFIPT